MYVILRYPRKQLQTRVGAVNLVSRHEAEVSSKSQVFDAKSRVTTGKFQASRKSAKHRLKSDSSLESRVHDSSLQLWLLGSNVLMNRIP